MFRRVDMVTRILGRHDGLAKFNTLVFILVLIQTNQHIASFSSVARNGGRACEQSQASMAIFRQDLQELHSEVLPEDGG